MSLFGEQGTVDDDGRLEYTFEPLLDSKLLIARFAVRETMRNRNTGERPYIGHSIGGWLT